MLMINNAIMGLGTEAKPITPNNANQESLNDFQAILENSLLGGNSNEFPPGEIVPVTIQTGTDAPILAGDITSLILKLTGNNIDQDGELATEIQSETEDEIDGEKIILNFSEPFSANPVSEKNGISEEAQNVPENNPIVNEVTDFSDTNQDNPVTKNLQNPNKDSNPINDMSAVGKIEIPIDEIQKVSEKLELINTSQKNAEQINTDTPIQKTESANGNETTSKLANKQETIIQLADGQETKIKLDSNKESKDKLQISNQAELNEKQPQIRDFSAEKSTPIKEKSNDSKTTEQITTNPFVSKSITNGETSDTSMTSSEVSASNLKEQKSADTKNGGENNNHNGQNHAGLNGELKSETKGETKILETVQANSFDKYVEKASSSKSAQVQSYSRVTLERFPEMTARISRTLMPSGAQNVKMAMNPEGLGTVFVNFEVHNGAVKLSIKSTNDDTLKKLEQQIGILKENIGKQGLKLENIELSKDQTSDSNERSGAENQSRNSHESHSDQKSILKHSGLAGEMDESQNLQDEASPVFKTSKLIEEYI